MPDKDVRLIYFWGVKCPSCKVMGPHIDQLIKEGWKGKIMKINTDTDRGAQLANKYGCMGVPTIVILKDGEMTNRRTGAMSLNAIKELLG